MIFQFFVGPIQQMSYWIKRIKNWTPFVFNGVSEIRSDRGCTTESLAKCKWWERPQWLRKSMDEWMRSEFFLKFEIVDAEKKMSYVSASNINLPTQQMFDKISSYDKLDAVIAWIYRFFFKLLRYFGFLSA